MNLRALAILLARRAQGETGAIARLLTAEAGLVAGYVAGGRGRQMRAVMVPGNRVALELTTRSASQLPFARLELEHSRAALMTEPLPAAAIQWVCALTAAALPERQAYPSLYDLRELGYGGGAPTQAEDLPAQLQALAVLEGQLAHYLLAGRKGDVMAARTQLTERLARMA